MLSKLLTFAACVFLSSTAFANFEPFTAKVTGTKVRLRTQPSLEGHVVRETACGEMFAVTGEVEGFYAITPPKGTKGYVFRTFVLDGTVEGEHVNVRLYPDIEAPIIAQLNTGDKINPIVSDVNNKWLVIDLPSTATFYLAHEYIEKIGPVELLAKLEARHKEATHCLNSVFLYAQSEIQKPLQQIDLDSINKRFVELQTSYSDLPEIVESAQEASHLLQDVYVQKKIAFLESKAEQTASVFEVDPVHLEKLAALGIDIPARHGELDVGRIAHAASNTLGLATTIGDGTITDKMLVWKPLEQSIYHLWAVAHGESSMEEFYKTEQDNAIFLSGIIEPYNRPVKNLPGDYLIRCDNHPIAFLYSTKIDLQRLVGRNVTIMATPRPNNNFAFPAYFVLSVE